VAKILYGFIITIIVAFFALKSNAGQKIIVMEIDTGLDPFSHAEIRSHINTREGDPLEFFDGNGHGTHVGGLILKGTCPEVELKSCSWFKLNASGDWNEYINCIRIAGSLKPDVINISSSGTNYDGEEFELLKELSDGGTKIIVAAGNQGRDLQYYPVYPANYDIKNLIVVGNIEDNGRRSITSNFGLPNEVYMPGIKVYSTLPGNKWGYMTGSSQSTARFTNKLLLEKCAQLKQ
jgi:subtilisin family serine protease